MKLTKGLRGASIKLKGPPDVNKVYADVLTDTRSVFLREGCVTSKSSYTYMDGSYLRRSLTFPTGSTWLGGQ